MARWIKLPGGEFLDAQRIMYVSKVESIPNWNDEGEASEQEYTVVIGTDLHAESHMRLTATKAEIIGVVKKLLGQED